MGISPALPQQTELISGFYSQIHVFIRFVMRSLYSSELESSYQLLERVFGKELPAEDYLPLLYILAEHLNERAISDLLAYHFAMEFSVIGNDVAKTQSIAPPSQADVDRVRAKLEQGGFSAWIKEEKIESKSGS